MVKPKGIDKSMKLRSKQGIAADIKKQKSSNSSNNNINNNHNNSNSNGGGFRIPMFNTILTASCIAVAVWFSYKGYLETRVNTPYDTEKLVKATGLDVPDRYWGTYRSNLYFGLKTRDPYSLVTGLMWYFPRYLKPGGQGLRHWCDQGDGIDRYAWLEHDGRSFGVQEIVDNGAVIETSFIKQLGGKYGGVWTSRIKVTSLKDRLRDNEEISLLFYTAIEEKTHGRITTVPGNTNEHLTSFKGNTKGLGSFQIHFNVLNGTIDEHSFLSTVSPGLHLLKETVLQNLRLVSYKGSNKKRIVLSGEQLPRDENGERLEPNFIVTQITGKVPFEFEVYFESESFEEKNIVGEEYDKVLLARRREFDGKFENTFGLRAKGFQEKEVKFAKMALSNMLGSIGYFYGTSQVQSVHTKVPVPYWKSALYSGVPSRSFFPRGFLWDEGFHGMLISSWDLEIELDIMNHWFDLMNIEGWIPREMILGSEALAKVPEEFVTQFNTNANPPTFFLTLDYILRHKREEMLLEHKDFLEKLYPRLQTWFDWFNTTQIGDLPGTYRWRGRDSLTNRELNPKTLTSGLDDYPRASHPNVDERHVDLRCWIALASRILADVSEILGRCPFKYQSTYDFLANNHLLNKQHWSPLKQRYADYGLHTDKVTLKRPPVPPRAQVSSSEMIRVVLEDPTLRFVDSTFGYVSLFPLILELMDANSPQLEKTLEDLTDPDLLWSNYGLRSLAKNSPLYMKYNTEHDPPYWRGAVWMNLNFLTARALNRYSKIEGPHQKQAKKVYKSLRDNLIKNVIYNYEKSGYIWENYDDTLGAGKGSHPFTGWSSLTLLLMAEIY